MILFLGLIIYFACFAIAYLLALSLSVIKNMHMFQLNSYKPLTHLKWMCKNCLKFLPQLLAVVLLFIYPLFENNSNLYINLWLFSFIAFCILSIPKKAKKAFVYTARVRRMVITTVVLVAGLFFLGYVLISVLLVSPIIAISFVAIGYCFLFGIVLYVISPFIPLIVNAINVPVESYIRRYYINDAKKILKSCPNLIVIGITGSYGKTSVKYYLNTLLKAKYSVLMTPESFNTPMGVVKTIREQLRATHEIFICEMGARSEGDIKELCDIVIPTHAIITAIGEQHLETFKSVDNIIKTKFELARAVSNKGILFLNGDSKFIRENLPNQKYQTYGLDEKNDYYAYNVKVTQNGTSFSINHKGEKLENFQTQLIGEHNVINLLGAIGLSTYLGVSFEDIYNQLKKISSPPHRLQLIKKNGLVIIDDAFNSNPSGCVAALKTLSLFDGYKILITPGMVELGSKQDDYNYEFGTKAAPVCDYVILVGEKQTKAIFEGLIDSSYDNLKIFVANSFTDAIKKAYDINSDKQKIILIENDLPDHY